MAQLSLSLKKEIESLMDKSDQEYNNENYIKSIDLLEEAWNKLPNPKSEYDESFHIVKYISETYLLIKNTDKAKQWAERIYECDLERIDSGERDFLNGKVAFEAADLVVAKKYFTTANNKSEGRCFENENEKYLIFFNS